MSYIYVLGLFLFEYTFDNIFFNNSFESLKKVFSRQFTRFGHFLNLNCLSNILTCQFQFFIVDDVYYEYVHGLSPIKKGGVGKSYFNCILQVARKSSTLITMMQYY